MNQKYLDEREPEREREREHGDEKREKNGEGRALPFTFLPIRFVVKACGTYSARFQI